MGVNVLLDLLWMALGNNLAQLLLFLQENHTHQSKENETWGKARGQKQDPPNKKEQSVPVVIAAAASSTSPPMSVVSMDESDDDNEHQEEEHQETKGTSQSLPSSSDVARLPRPRHLLQEENDNYMIHELYSQVVHLALTLLQRRHKLLQQHPQHITETM